jgi:hypothetical protein
MEETTTDTGLKMNIHKTKYTTTLKYKHKNMQPKNKHINYKEYQEVLQCIYFGSLVTYDNYCGKDVRARITAGNQS